MQLIALAKNDEQYFKRIEELKNMQLELAQYREIAKTVKEADMYLAQARQRAEEVVEKAEQEANDLRRAAIAYVEEHKHNNEQAKNLRAELKAKKADMELAQKEAEKVKAQMEQSIKEHRELTAARNFELSETQKVRKEIQDKFEQIKRIINH